MCRETEAEWYLGGADLEDTLVSLQPRTGKQDLEGVRSPEPQTEVLGVRVEANLDKEEQQRVVLDERPEVVRSPVVPTRKTFSTQKSARLLPYFPKHGITSPPTPQSLSRNADLLTSQSPSPPPSKLSARNPSPLPATRASASNLSSVIASSKAGARNPSPGPASRISSRNQSSEKVLKATPTNPSSATASRATARNPSPTPAPRITPRNPSPTPASRAAARNPSPTPAARTPSSARTPSPGPASRGNPVQSSSKNLPTPSSNGKTVTSARRPASPALTRKEPSRPLYDDNGRRIVCCTPDSARKSAVMGSPASSLDSSGELSPRSSLDVNKALRMSISRSLKKEGLGQWSPESPTFSPIKKLTPLELQTQKKERIAGYGRKGGTPKSGRVACEGMLPGSPIKTDVRRRCHWITPQSDSGLVAYHDEEWGVPVHDDKLLFELLVLEGVQSELTRPQILGMREYFREVFAGFVPEIVAKFDEKKVAALKADEIIRQPEAKLRSVIDNAKQLLKVAEEFGSFDKYLWNFVGFKPIVNTNRIFTQIPVKSSKSEALSKDLMRRGFRYVGPTTVYSFMQAAGMVDDHLVSCYRHRECCEISQMQATDSSFGQKKSF